MENIAISSQQESTIDYPGKMGLILFTSGCNFRCGFCHNPELVNEQLGRVNINILLKNIESRKNAGWYHGICISGGEPTLHTGLFELIKKIKDMDLCVKLDTNGAFPEVLKRLLNEKLVDYLAIDIKAPQEKYSEVTSVNVNLENINESIRLAKLFPTSEFRTTVLPFFTVSDFEEIGRWISDNGKSKVKLYTIQQFNPIKTLELTYQNFVPKSKEEIYEIAEVMKKYAEEVRVLI